ncbi:hypothetical protein DY000_02057687 [Brassica cretica]|uniref:RanBP2-type domain-containing protein n=1 Tax=Brassica cretica TaxID=69181 RepID=A0ABQ7AMY5_BRACR|nr:hypothetical protein DY000_02057687 [Brassica cretica]
MFIPQLSVTEAQFHDLLVSIPSSLSVSSNHEYKWACEGCTFLNTYKNSVCDYPRNAIVVVFSSPDWLFYLFIFTVWQHENDKIQTPMTVIHRLQRRLAISHEHIASLNKRKTELVISKTTTESLQNDKVPSNQAMGRNVSQPIKQQPCPLPQRSNALSDKKGKKHIDEARQQYDRLSSITAEQSFLSP